MLRCELFFFLLESAFVFSFFLKKYKASRMLYYAEPRKNVNPQKEQGCWCIGGSPG